MLLTAAAQKRMGIKDPQPAERRQFGDPAVPVTFVKARNTTFISPKDARCGAATTHCRTDGRIIRAWKDIPPELRFQAELEARNKIIKVWEDRWGPIPWDQAEWRIVHLSVQCMVQLIVRPE